MNAKDLLEVIGNYIATFLNRKEENPVLKEKIYEYCAKYGDINNKKPLDEDFVYVASLLLENEEFSSMEISEKVDCLLCLELIKLDGVVNKNVKLEYNVGMKDVPTIVEKRLDVNLNDIIFLLTLLSNSSIEVNKNASKYFDSRWARTFKYLENQGKNSKELLQETIKQSMERKYCDEAKEFAYVLTAMNLQSKVSP
jgi:hypothetical protein